MLEAAEEIEIINSPRVTHMYLLTAKGKKVAEKLREIEGIIGTRQ